MLKWQHAAYGKGGYRQQTGEVNQPVEIQLEVGDKIGTDGPDKTQHSATGQHQKFQLSSSHAGKILSAS
jgi:hypothetical protein